MYIAWFIDPNSQFFNGCTIGGHNLLQQGIGEFGFLRATQGNSGHPRPTSELFRKSVQHPL
jgi:hypothetical protein